MNRIAFSLVRSNARLRSLRFYSAEAEAPPKPKQPEQAQSQWSNSTILAIAVGAAGYTLSEFHTIKDEIAKEREQRQSDYGRLETRLKAVEEKK
ncbi:hypothetical protein M427DRAFT_39641 [Gonapodya prolifera JEL478]|uniref:Uncharacterized protein n=1 Tax=Gonapodya prolifera (strain JEL478) TaxID=1344416 RepID=A0A138ZX93_GONPJ|nr:hypothetical protein M427DRAFT_39641 [Gonapodya prolifera JEL478]|eukprot:KXS09071.1 hypothetical protein M427DRAFT_39641 [Gonapodya prolifera JEL478]